MHKWLIKVLQPINVINALRTGSQVQAPSYVNPALQSTTQGPDILGATGQQYNAQLAQTNANNAAAGGFFGGLVNLGGAALGAPVGTFSGISNMFSNNTNANPYASLPTYSSPQPTSYYSG